MYLPRAATIKKETNIQMVKDRFVEVAKEYGCKNGRDWTLTKEENEELKSLGKKSKEGELVVIETDKTGKFMLMGRQEFLDAGDIHTKEDKVIDKKGLSKVERKLNAACSLFIKIFRVGEAKGYTERHRSNSITLSSNPSNMKLLHKDHKGPESRQMRRLNGLGMNVN